VLNGPTVGARFASAFPITAPCDDCAAELPQFHPTASHVRLPVRPNHRPAPETDLYAGSPAQSTTSPRPVRTTHVRANTWKSISGRDVSLAAARSRKPSSAYEPCCDRLDANSEKTPLRHAPRLNCRMKPGLLVRMDRHPGFTANPSERLVRVLAQFKKKSPCTRGIPHGRRFGMEHLRPACCSVHFISSGTRRRSFRNAGHAQYHTQTLIGPRLIGFDSGRLGRNAKIPEANQAGLPDGQIT